MTPVRVERGDGPVVLAFLHSGIHVPVEIAGRLPPFAYDAAKAERLRAHLAEILETIDAMARSGHLAAKGEDA